MTTILTDLYARPNERKDGKGVDHAVLVTNIDIFSRKTKSSLLTGSIVFL